MTKTPKQEDSDKTTRFCKTIREQTYSDMEKETRRFKDAENV